MNSGPNLSDLQPLASSRTLNILDLSASIHNITDLDILIDFSLESVLSLVDACAGSFFIWDDRKKELILKAVRGPQRDRLNNVQIKLREGILGWVGDRGDSILVKNISEDERFQAIKRQGRYRSNSFISVPLITNHKLIGVINVTEKESLNSFDENDMALAQGLAKHIAYAYENLRMLSHLRKDNQEIYHKYNELKHTHKVEESLITVGKLATHLAHELNNPLDAIRRYVNLALDQSMQDSLSREYLLKAKKGIRRAIHVIRGLLQLSRESYNETSKAIEIHELINQSLIAITEDLNFQKITVEKNFTATPSFIRDKGLHLVLKNLFQNAQHAMNGEGKIVVSTHRVNGTIIISVEDTGMGVSDSIKTRLFEPFFSTKNREEGTGIGLAICKEIVERCGGSISCENNSGGAKFIISIPCLKEGALS